MTGEEIFEKVLDKMESNVCNLHCCILLSPFVTTRPIPVPTSNLVCIKIAFIVDSQLLDLNYGCTFSNHCEVIILSIISLARLKDKVKSLGCKTILREIKFHLLFDGEFIVV